MLQLEERWKKAGVEEAENHFFFFSFLSKSKFVFSDIILSPKNSRIRNDFVWSLLTFVS